MKGLLIKDLMLLKSSKTYLITVIFFAVIFLALQDSPHFAVGYVTMLCVFSSISTISYDDMGDGISYLFTLPIKRSSYVREKYLLAVLSAVIPCLIINIIAIIVFNYRGIDINFDEYAFTVPVYVMIAFAVVLFEIPVIFKWGNEKARVMIFLLVGIIVGSGYALYYVSHNTNINIIGIIDNLSDRFSTGMAVALIAFLTIIFTFISYKISLGIIRKREF